MPVQIIGARRIFSKDEQIRGVGTKVPQRGPEADDRL